MSVNSELVKEHWVQMQVKTFTKWFNTKLTKEGFSPINDLFVDLNDGVQIHNLLTALGRNPPEIQMKPIFKIQRMENVNTLLEFVKSRGITLVNIGAEDIVDGEQKLILGFVWTLISKMVFSEDLSTNAAVGFKSELLDWTKYVTRDYSNINIENFTTSWTDGLGFTGLVHYFHPELIENPINLNSKNSKQNLENVFSIAEKDLEISRLIDVEDLAGDMYPDEKSIMTYIMMFYEKFKDIEKLNYVKFGVKNIFKNLDSTLKEREILKIKSDCFSNNKKLFLKEVEELKNNYNSLIKSIDKVDKLNAILMKDSFDINASYYNIKALDLMSNHKFDLEIDNCKVNYNYYNIKSIIDIIKFNEIIDKCQNNDMTQLDNLNFNTDQYLDLETKSITKFDDKSQINQQLIYDLLNANYSNKNNHLVLPFYKKLTNDCFARIEKFKEFKKDNIKNIELAENLFNKYSKNDKISFAILKRIGHTINQIDFDLLELDKSIDYSKDQMLLIISKLFTISYSKDAIPNVFKLFNCDSIDIKEITGEHLEYLIKEIGEKATVEELMKLLYK